MILVAIPVERVNEENEHQVKALLKTKHAFSALGLGNLCGTRIENANMV